jgi:hypothetical protein
VIGLAVFFSLSRNTGSAAGTHIADQGPSLHLQNPEDPLPVPYNSNPPTSGYHWGGGVAPWGVQNRPLADTITVHNLEHGGVIIHYREDLDAISVSQLAELTRTLQRRNPCIIMQPRVAAQIDSPVIVTAWTYMLKLDSADTNAITEFFSDRVGRGPEAVCRPSA